MTVAAGAAARGWGAEAGENKAPPSGVPVDGCWGAGAVLTDAEAWSAAVSTGATAGAAGLADACQAIAGDGWSFASVAGAAGTLAGELAAGLAVASTPGALGGAAETATPDDATGI